MIEKSLMRRFRVVFVAVIALLIPQILSPNNDQAKVGQQELAPKYKDWLKLVTYIILPQERDVFNKLASDVERDIFLEAFWKQRDPTPGTPENEYRDEINRRFKYVNTELQRGSAREGWQTDKGRIYMILGPPVGRESISSPVLQPCEIWSYYGDSAKGQPTNFGFIFFRREGGGDYQLYSPMGDGPARLLIDKGEIDLSDNSQVYATILESAPTLAPFVLSYIPNEMTYGLSPSLRSDSVLADILESPRKDINPSYATHFLKYKGIVSTEYMTNFVDSEGSATVLEDPLQEVLYLHYAVVPKTISVDYFEPKNQFYCSYTVDVSLRRGEDVIYQYSKDYSYYFPEADSDMVKANGVSIQDAFPVAEGKFRLTVLLRNAVAKEFSLFEKDLIVERAKQPKIYGPVLGYKLDSVGADTLAAFKLLDQRLQSDPRNTFTNSELICLLFNVADLTEDIWKSGRIRLAVQSLQRVPPLKKDYEIRLSDYAYRSSMSLHYSFPAADLAQDYFEIRLSLVDGDGRVVDERTSNFIISPSPALPRPVILSKAFPRSNSYYYDYILAGQYEKIGNPGAAAMCLERAYRAAPDYPEGIVYFSGFLLRSGKYEQALERIEKIKDLQKYHFSYCLIKGQILKEMGKYSEALDVLLEGNKIYNSDARLLNALAFCFWKTGQKERAVQALEASLKLNPDQPDAKKLAEEIRR
jgi:GWxTD domain-containing protein